MVSSERNDRTGTPRIDGRRSTLALPLTQHQRFSRSAALALYERELAFYRADEAYLPVEKCAERCCKLSFLLTAAAYGNSTGDTAAAFVLR